MASAGTDLASGKPPQVLLFEAPMQSRPSTVSIAVKRRLSDRVKSAPDAYEIARKHKEARDRAFDALMHIKAREHNKKVAENVMRAVMHAQEKRVAIARALRSRLEKAETVRRNKLEDTLLRAKKVIEKHEKALSNVHESQQKTSGREVNLQVELLLASEKRNNAVTETRQRAAQLTRRSLEARFRRAMMESTCQDKLHGLEERIASAALRRAEERSKLKTKVARYRAREQLIQTKQKINELELAMALSRKMKNAEANREAMMHYISARAAFHANRKVGAASDLEKAELIKAKIEAHLDAARERRRRSLDDTIERAAAVMRKVVEVAAVRSTKETEDRQKALKDLYDRIQQAAERHALALSARKSKGISGFMTAMNLSPPASPTRTSPRYRQSLPS